MTCASWFVVGSEVKVGEYGKRIAPADRKAQRKVVKKRKESLLGGMYLL